MSKRRFFSGNTLGSALMAAAREFEIKPEEVKYQPVEKRHGFVNSRKRFLIEVDADDPRLETPARPLPAPSASSLPVAEPVQPQQARPAAPARPKPEAVKVDDSEPAEVRERKSEGTKAESDRSESGGRGRGRRGGRGRGGQGRSDQGRSDQGRSDQARSDEARSDKGRGDEARGDQGRGEKARRDGGRGDQGRGGRGRGGESGAAERQSDGRGGRGRQRKPGGRGRGDDQDRGGRGRRGAPRRRFREEPESQSELAEFARQALDCLLDLMRIDAWGKVYETAERIEIDLEGRDTKLLLRHYGKGLFAMEHLMPKMIRSLGGELVPCRVDCDGFHEMRERELGDLAERTARQVVRKGRAVTLDWLNPAERRIVHLALADNPEVFTESIGKGYLKRLSIRLAGQEEEDRDEMDEPAEEVQEQRRPRRLDDEDEYDDEFESDDDDDLDDDDLDDDDYDDDDDDPDDDDYDDDDDDDDYDDDDEYEADDDEDDDDDDLDDDDLDDYDYDYDDEDEDEDEEDDDARFT